MPFPTGWPPRVSSGRRSLRVLIEATATANYEDRAYLFAQLTGANPYTPLPYVRPGSQDTVAVPATPWGSGENANDINPGYTDPTKTTYDVTKQAPPEAMIFSQGIRITNTHASAVLRFSFDGTNDHGVVQPQTSVIFYDRHEAGIALKGNTATFIVEAW
jgi:hypothetical protein